VEEVGEAGVSAGYYTVFTTLQWWMLDRFTPDGIVNYFAVSAIQNNWN
jgi:hypothetical protein